MASKNGIAIPVCVNAANMHMPKLFVAGKYKKPTAFKRLMHLPVIYKAENAWMTAGIFKERVVFCFVFYLFCA